MHTSRRPLFDQFHLVSDLDGSWLPPGTQASEVRTLVAALGCRECHLTFATGRDLASTQEVLRQCGRDPEYLITDVGTAIHRKGLYGWEEDLTYRAYLSSRWDEEKAAKVMERLPEGIEPQPNLSPSRRLALQLTDPEGKGLAKAAKALRAVLREVGLKAQVVPSHGRFLEVLPRGVDKGSAVQWLRASDQIEDPLLVCGDSENDLAMLKLAAAAVVLPGNGLNLPATVTRSQVHQSSAAGPLGILEALRSWRLVTA